jgi:predicted RNA binding protein YcfA (HicA-like mRNA interferase family)
MGKYDRLFERVMGGDADASINFSELCNLLSLFGFEMRIKGSHHIFRKHEIVEKINLQKDGSKAKPYQVKQVRLVVLKYNLKIANDA